MRLSINMESVFGDTSVRQAFECLVAHGYDTFERWTIEPGEVMRLREQMRLCGLRMAACCPDTFTLNNPDAHEAYEASLLRAFGSLRALGCRKLITQVGQITRRPRAAQHDAIVQGLRRVAPLLESHNMTLLVEPLNDVRDHPGYYLTSSDEGYEIIRAVQSPSVRLLYDVYHQLHMGEDVLSQIDKGLDLIGHFHVAGFPARDERLFDGYDYRALFAYLNAKEVDAYVGIELFPSAPDCVPALLDALSAFR